MTRKRPTPEKPKPPWDVGDETGDESSPRPGENLVDEIGEEVGIEFAEGEPIRPIEKMAERDEKRWELDPASDQDYPERLKEQDEP